MRKPLVPRARREELLQELGTMRTCDCQWPRRYGSRPRCGRCFGCDQVVALEIRGARIH